MLINRQTTQALRIPLTIAVCLILLGGQTAVAEERVLEAITVTAPGLPAESLDTPAATDVVAGAELQTARQRLALDEALNRVPGLFLQNRYNFAQNLRLSIRGFGARAPFGVRGIHIRVDGIPETLPDGQSQVDVIDLETAERVEVLRGPSSARYGNAAGGVIEVTTRQAPEQPYVETRLTGGSDGQRRAGILAGRQQGAWNSHISAWHMNYDGYREHSRTEKMMLHGKVSYDITPGRELTTVFTAYDQPTGEDPGGLTRAEVEADRQQAAPNSLALDAGQSVTQQRLGLIYDDRQSLPGELTLTAFYTHRNFQQQLPFPGPSLLGYDRDFFGASARYRDAGLAGNVPFNWELGTEVRAQRDDRERFLVSGDGVRGEQIQDALESATGTGVYGQLEAMPADPLVLRLGTRYDRVRLAIDDRRGGGQASGDKSFDEFNLSAGPVWRYHPRHSLYATVGTAFETPTFTEFYDPTEPDQGFDPSLEPQQAMNLETGLKGRRDSWRYSLALYRIQTRDEIVQVSSAPDRFANVGDTRRHGVELGLEYFPTDQWSFTGAYTHADYRFNDDPRTLDGNRLPGLPAHRLFIEAAWQNQDWFAALDGLGVSRVYADDSNQVEVDGYAVLNARLSRTLRQGARNWELSLGINNLTDRDYFSNVRVNASAERYFEPAPGRHYYAGLRLRFQ
jgi:iron complex outermembrane receptor protein